MEGQQEPLAEEIKRLRRCNSDLVSILALPAIWSGGEPSQIVRTLLDALLGMLRLDLVYVRLEVPIGASSIEAVRFAPSQKQAVQPREIRALLSWLDSDPQKWPAHVRARIGDTDLSIAPLRLGLGSEFSVLVVGSQRADFPEPTERLILGVAANQAAVGLQEAKLLSEQKRLNNELDQRVAQRTTELATANHELVREIAERKLAQERLSEEERELTRSKEFLARAQQLSSTGSFSWRIATDEITWSEELFRIYELDSADPVTLELISSRFHPDDLPLLSDMIERARREDGDFDFEHRLKMPDGAMKYVHLLAHGTRDRNGQPEYVGAIQDVTERRVSENALARARSDLAHVSRVTSLGALTASIAHEVNQPLSGIITNAGTCLRMLANDPPNVEGARETARRTIRDGNRASEVITRLRALFTNRQTARELVDLNEATREIIALSLSEFQRSRVILRTELVDDLPPIAGDRVQLQQVMLNLFLNAMDAMNDVDERPRQMVVSSACEPGIHVRLSVQDSGVGFRPGEQERLFEAFYTTKSGGMGIGLSVSRSIIETHHGRLWATPNQGPGATFSFSIPCIASPSSSDLAI